MIRGLNKYLTSCLLISNFIASSVAFAAEKGITFQGVIRDGNEQLVSGTSSNITVQILGANNASTDCILYQETFLNHPLRDGYLNLTIGGGDPGSYSSVSFKNVFNNNSGIQSSLNCLNNTSWTSVGSGSFNPTSSSTRKLRLIVSVPGASEVFNAIFNLRSSAFASYSDISADSHKLNGKTETDFVNITSDVTQSKADSLFGSHWTKLLSILNSLNYDGSGNYTGSISGNAATATTAGNVTGIVAIANGGTGATSQSGARSNLGLGPLAILSTSGTPDGSKFLRDDGAWMAIASGGTLTALTGDVTASGTGSVAATVAQVGGVSATNVASGSMLANAATDTNTASSLVRRDASGNFGAGTISATSFVGNLTGSLTGSASNNVLKAGDSMTNALTMSPYGAGAGNTSEVRFGELATNGANYVGFKAPDMLSANSIWTLPSVDGANGQVLQTNGSGVLNWASVGTGSVTSIATGAGLTGGPITGTGTIGLGTELAGLNGVSTTGYISRSGAGVYSTTVGNILASASTVVQRNGSGVSGFYGVDIQGATSGVVTFLAPSVVTNYSITLPNTQGGVGQVLSNNGSGSFSWVTPLLTGTGTIDSTHILDGTILNTDINSSAAIDRSKLASGSPYRLVTNNSSGALTDAAAITANRALASDANGIPEASSVTSTELGYLSGVTSAIQTQLSGKQASLGFTPVDKAGDTMTGVLNLPSNGLAVGTDQLIVTGGNIGIGTASPATRLHVASGNGREAQLVIGAELLNLYTARAGIQVGNSADVSEVMIGQDSTHFFNMAWVYNATPASSYGAIQTSTSSLPLALQLNGGSVGIGTNNPKGSLHVMAPGVNHFSYIQGSGNGGTVLTGSDPVPMNTGNGFDGYGGLALIPDRWGNATTVDAHNVLNIVGSQRNVGQKTGTLAFSNWGYFTGTGSGVGELGNSTAQADAVKFKFQQVDLGSAFNQRLDILSRSASGVDKDVLSILSSGFIGMGVNSPQAPLHLNPLIAGAPPANSGTTPSTGIVARWANQGGATLDHGMLSNGAQWLQATNVADQSFNYSILLNPNQHLGSHRRWNNGLLVVANTCL